MSTRSGPARPGRLLLHICCGPCASVAAPFFVGTGAKVLGYFFNPNIHPYLEFRRRLTAAKEAAHYADVPLEIEDAYDPEDWFRAVGSGKGSRCDQCVALRLGRTAQAAAEYGCEAFATSLSVSPWQDHEAIKASGQKAGREHGVRFIYEDLRPHYGASRDLSKRLGLYRQKYCGCLVSEWERYRAST